SRAAGKSPASRHRPQERSPSEPVDFPRRPRLLAVKLRRETVEGEDGEGNPPAPRETSPVGDGDWLETFLLLWIVIPILFFSISRSKLPGYILPVIPAGAVLTADYLHCRRALPRPQL